MKKFFLITIITFFYLTPLQSNDHRTIGEGDFTMPDYIIEYFQKYIKTKGGKKPETFVVAVDGSYATFWYCGTGNCAVGDEKNYIKQCEIDSGVRCKVFARKRYVKWLNGINPGKGKISKISSKLSFSELKSKLKELGFVD